MNVAPIGHPKDSEERASGTIRSKMYSLFLVSIVHDASMKDGRGGGDEGILRTRTTFSTLERMRPTVGASSGGGRRGAPLGGARFISIQGVQRVAAGVDSEPSA